MKLEKTKKKEYSYKSEIFKKGQVHINFPDIIYKKKSYANPMKMFSRMFRLKGDHSLQIKTLKSLIKFMDMLEEGKVDYNSPATYFPMYVLESKWMLKFYKQKLVLNKKAKLLLEAMKETIELYGDENVERFD